jgi:tetratricopeptide (TPR) repeat protein
MEVNQDFNSGKEFQKEGDYQEALTSFQSALPQAQDSTQKAQIEFDIAYMTELSGNHLGSIALFKQIVANTSYDPIVRAYSVQELGIIYSSYADTSAIAAEIYKDAPYNSFLVDGDLSTAYRKLYEYSDSIYPLGGSEAHVAQLYSADILTRLQGATTTPEGAAEVSLVQQSLQKANADIGRMENDISESATIPDTYMREAIAYANLAAVGATDPSQAEIFFQKALTTNTAIDNPVNFINFYYAGFLATQFGSARASDIQTLLSVYSTKNAANLYQNVPTIFTAARSDPSLVSIKSSLVLLGEMDSGFKTYLLSLGWYESDFTTTKSN